ncbi:hypothetical protein F751_2629 [Auxenochlorella protothecoides]|uniref:Uncharacterized protein n=1 Tax=Auxenochlorella protothecoides TaxID=3075 RepID=A0A087SJ83_AUXPR|nr:hypothetical protein F751_2629 [Auxenochlorella protothecoides]KFM25787.1 hypothetical protein F751_2629 [Auxenochlorella protothecoides]
MPVLATQSFHSTLDKGGGSGLEQGKADGLGQWGRGQGIRAHQPSPAQRR